MVRPAAIGAISLPLLTTGTSLLAFALLLQLTQYELLALELLTDDTLSTALALDAAVATLPSSLVLLDASLGILLASLGTVLSIAALRRHGTPNPTAATLVAIATSVAPAVVVAMISGGIALAASDPPAAVWGTLDPTLVAALIALPLEAALIAPLGALLWHHLAVRRRCAPPSPASR